VKIIIDGVERWQLKLSDAHYVWERAGIDLREFDGHESGACSRRVQELIAAVMADPQRFIWFVGYLDLRATMAALMELFFILCERPGATVRTEAVP
jgi:hypothetical protein